MTGPAEPATALDEALSTVGAMAETLAGAEEHIRADHAALRRVWHLAGEMLANVQPDCGCQACRIWSVAGRAVRGAVAGGPR